MRIQHKPTWTWFEKRATNGKTFRLEPFALRVYWFWIGLEAKPQRCDLLQVLPVLQSIFRETHIVSRDAIHCVPRLAQPGCPAQFGSRHKSMVWSKILHAYVYVFLSYIDLSFRSCTKSIYVLSTILLNDVTGSPENKFPPSTPQPWTFAWAATLRCIPAIPWPPPTFALSCRAAARSISNVFWS